MLDQITSYFREVASSLKFQVSAAITFGAALVLVWFKEDSELKIFLTVLFLFPTCMLIGSLSEKGITFIKKRKERKLQTLKNKLGLLGEHRFTDKLSELWADKDFEGLGWQIYVDVHSKSAYLTHPCCFDCKADLITRTNSKCDGFYLECPDCKKKFDVNDIGKTRAIANASLQGDVRNNGRKYFNLF